MKMGKRLVIWIPKHLSSLLQRAASERQETLSETARRALEEGLSSPRIAPWRVYEEVDKWIPSAVTKVIRGGNFSPEELIAIGYCVYNAYYISSVKSAKNFVDLKLFLDLVKSIKDLFVFLEDENIKQYILSNFSGLSIEETIAFIEDKIEKNDLLFHPGDYISRSFHHAIENLVEKNRIIEVNNILVRYKENIIKIAIKGARYLKEDIHAKLEKIVDIEDTIKNLDPEIKVFLGFGKHLSFKDSNIAINFYLNKNTPCLIQIENAWITGGFQLLQDFIDSSLLASYLYENSQNYYIRGDYWRISSSVEEKYCFIEAYSPKFNITLPLEKRAFRNIINVVRDLKTSIERDKLLKKVFELHEFVYGRI